MRPFAGRITPAIIITLRIRSKRSRNHALSLAYSMKRNLPFILIGVVLLLAVAGGAILYRAKQRALAASTIPDSGKPGAQPPHIRGTARAPVTLEEFGDFQCLPCNALSTVLKQVEKDYASRLRVIFREYPLAMHAHALEAARAAEAAGLQGRFWEMYDMLYQTQLVWSKLPNVQPAFAQYAQNIGIDLDRFNKDMTGDEPAKRIAADRDRAASLGVDRTPVIFVNSQQLPHSSLTVEGLHEAIDAALQRRKSG